MKCLKDRKNQKNQPETRGAASSEEKINEPVKIKEEVVDEEHEIEFVPVESYSEELPNENVRNFFFKYFS